MIKNRTIPFGYCVRNGQYQLKDTESDAVKIIFRQYIEGMSLKSIADQMTVPYHECKSQWNKNMVLRILENQHYTGDDRFPQIISKEDFELAKKIKDSRCTYKNSVKPKNFTDEKMSENSEMTYQQTEEIMRMTNEINRLIDTPGSDSEEIRKMIFKCAELKYYAVTAERSGHDCGNST